MKTKASFFGHPIHMMLVHFPIGLLVAAFCFDAAGRLLGRPDLWLVGGFLVPAGLVAGVAAAVPGVVDFVSSVPKPSRTATRTIRHAAVSAAALGAFVGAWILRGGVSTEPTVVVMGVEGLGVLLLSVAGFLGGALVIEDRVGLDEPAV